MGKIVKLCSSCDEGFAEKFVFCPNCGSTLEAFEMNPVQASAEPVTEAAPPVQEPVPVVQETKPYVPETSPEPAVPAFKAPEAPAVVASSNEASAPTEQYDSTWEAGALVEEPVLELNDEPIAAAADTEEEAEAAYVPVPAVQPVFARSTAVDIDRAPASLSAEHDRYAQDGGFYVTVIEEKNGATRNGLIAGAFFFMIGVLLTGLVINIFSKDLDVGSINDDVFNAVIVDDVPTAVEEEIQKKNNDKGGGGGGGGREEKEEVTKGDLADQAKDPIRPPDAKIPRLDNPELTLPPPSTQGNQTFKKENQVWGDPNGRFTNFSNGTGSGGGQGSGVGTGQGSGRGTGAGSGIGSGYGNGIGNGNGNGTGNGDGNGDGGPPPRVAGVTQGIKILSKPRPGYTDEARQNNVQGTVILRVTFNANGSVGGVSAVKGLPNGLTEQAIAAARRIGFEPAKVNGVPQSVTKQIEYTFSIY